MLVADYVMNRVAETGVKHVFLVPGGGSMYLVDALGRHPELKPVAMLHEQGASIAAEAYAQFSGNLGVALVTTGPGGTNAMTGVAAAFLDSTPLLILSGQVKTADSAVGRGLRQLGFQEIDVIAMAKPVTKMAVRVTNPAQVIRVVEEAIAVALGGRPGPVWVDIPLDVQSSELFREEQFAISNQMNSVNHDQVKEIVDDFHNSKKPVFLVGNGVRLAHAEKILEEIIEVTGIPFLLTWKALDLFPFDHPGNAGRPGAIATHYSNFTHQFCDAYLAVGARLDMGQTGYRPDNIAPRANRYIVDIDSNELEKLAVSGSNLIHADALSFFTEFLVEAKKKTWKPFSEWTEQISAWKRDYPLLSTSSKDNLLSNYDVVDVLSDIMREGDIFVPGSSGACSEVSMQAFRNKKGQRVFNSEGLGPMGFGVPAPIGAWFVDQTRAIYSIDGDGGFQMNTQELEVAARGDMAICWIVLDNNGYGSIRASQDNFFEGRRVASDPPSGLTLPSVEKISEAYGISSEVVTSRLQLKDCLEEFQNRMKPKVIVAKVDQNQRTAPRVLTRRLDDGSLVSDALEDISPKASPFR